MVIIGDLPMDALQIIRRLHQHRAWANAKLIAAIGELTDEQRRAPFAIGQGSLWKSLLHLYAAEHVWLEANLGCEDFIVPGDLPGKIPGNQEGEHGISQWDDLAQRWRALDQRWNDFLAALTPAALEETVYRKRTVSGQIHRLGTRRADALLHVCTHAHYTTAQVVNMLRQLGVQPLPDPMLISLARQETQSPSS
jgi:uncharacterized damage-inducible protein DinB